MVNREAKIDGINDPNTLFIPDFDTSAVADPTNEIVAVAIKGIIVLHPSKILAIKANIIKGIIYNVLVSKAFFSISCSGIAFFSL